MTARARYGDGAHQYNEAEHLAALGASSRDEWDPDYVPDTVPWDGIATGESPRPAPPSAPSTPTFPAPEDRGHASLSALGDVEYVDDLLRPGRIMLVAAEESSGKSYAIDSELGIRMALAGGSFAETWQIHHSGPVLYLSEMHPDDDHHREAEVLASLGRERGELEGRYYRLSLYTAAGGAPALTVPQWRAYITGWLREHGAILLIVDTATGATQVDPWGKAIQAVYADIRAMLAEYPALAVILIVHLKKPQGRAARGLADVLGEWGRWNDVTLLLESEGADQTKLTLRKRVRRERRIVATKRGGLLVEPRDAEGGSTTKVATDVVRDQVMAHPQGMTYRELGGLLGVSADTASRYVKALAGDAIVVPGTNKRPALVYPRSAAPHSSAGEAYGAPAELPAVEGAAQHRSAASAYIDAELLRAEQATADRTDPETANDSDEPPTGWAS